MNHSIKDKLKVSQLLAPQTISASGNSSSVDLQFANACMFLVAVGAMAFDGSNLLDLTIEHSDDNSSFSPVAEEDMYDPETSSIYKKLDAAGDANAVHQLNYRGNKRYARVAYAETGTVSVPMAVEAVLGHNELNPAL